MDNSRWAVAVAIALCAPFSIGLCAAGPEPSSGPPQILVIDPVDLGVEGDGQRLWGELLRQNMEYSGFWQVIPRDSADSRYSQYGLEPEKGCREFQCAYDAGTVVGANFVLFGTVTGLREIYAYTLNLVHVGTVQTVWSRVGEVVRKRVGNPAQAVQTVLGDLISHLDPSELNLQAQPKRGLTTVVDLNSSLAFSRVMAERTTTHLYASREFNVMTQRELIELLSAMEIDLRAVPSSDDSILAIGKQADVSHLVASRLTQEKGVYALHLRFFDVAEGKKLRDWPSQATPDFKKILQFEQKFFAGLFKNQENVWKPAQTGEESQAWWPYAASGILLTAGAVMGFLAYEADKEADREYRKFNSAQSRDAAMYHRSRVETLDRTRLWLGGSAGISIGFGFGVFFM